MEIVMKVPEESEKKYIFRGLNNYNKKLYGDKITARESYFWTKKMLSSIYNPKRNHEFVGLYEDNQLCAMATFASKEDSIIVHEIIPVNEEFYNKNKQDINDMFLLFFAKRLEVEGKRDFLIEVDVDDSEFIDLITSLGFELDSKENVREDDATAIYKISVEKKREKARRRVIH